MFTFFASNFSVSFISSLISQVAMFKARKNVFNFVERYGKHHKLVVYHHYIVYFINNTKHIDDISPDIRKSMITNSFEPDVTFIVDGLSFPGYKQIIRISNEQFYIQHVEPHQNTNGIVVENVNPAGFQQFLRFCHFGDLNFNPLNMMHTYDVAQTYSHSTLLALCTNFICENVQTSNVLKILDWNLNHQNYRIMQCCRGFLIENAMEVLNNTDQFHKISEKLLKVILSWEVINCSEKLLFNKTLSWAEQQCHLKQLQPTTENQKVMLADVLDLIRLEVSPDLEVSNEFPTNSRANRFSKRRFDNLLIEDNIEQTWEEIEATCDDVTCNGFSIILSNPESKIDAREHFLMTIENGSDVLYQKEFSIKTHDYLSIKDFVFEEPVVMEKQKRHVLKVKFFDSKRLRYMEKDGESNSKLLRLYD